MRRSVFLVLALAVSTSCSLCAELPDPPADTGLDAGADACVPESDAELCEGEGLTCGSGNASDRCGTERTFDCGPCADASDDAAGDTAGDMSGDAAMCGDCSTLDGVCMVGTCDTDSGQCVAQAADDGVACPDTDGLTCTVSACDGGACAETLQPGFCVIDGACFAIGDRDPGNTCFVCDPATSTTSFTQAVATTACDDGDGLDCTVGTCDDTGVCQSELDPNNCLVGTTCYASGEGDPGAPCDQCDPLVSTTALTPAVEGAACSTTECTTGTCSAGACLNEVADPDTCRIGDVCYDQAAVNPANECEICDSANPTDWSTKPVNTSCGSSGNCRCTSNGQCRRNNGQLCS